MSTKKSFLASWQGNFMAGLAIVLPAVISIAVVIWLFGTVSNITDKLLFLVPRELKYVDGRGGEMHGYWSLVALLIAVGLVTLVGRIARHIIGKKLIALGENLLLQVPLLNRIYATVKQVKEAFAGKQSSFQQAVLVEFPRPGVYSLGFVTSARRIEVPVAGAPANLSVFVPTTPNPTTGFLIFLPESQVIRLEIPVADAILSIVSLGAVSPRLGPAPVPAAPRPEP